MTYERPPVPAPALRERVLRDAQGGAELVTWPDGRLSLAVETGLGRARFRCRLDASLGIRLQLELPPPRGDLADLRGLSGRTWDMLAGRDRSWTLARLARDAALREAGSGTPPPDRATALGLLAAELSAWLRLPPASRSDLAGFLAARGTPMPDPCDAESGTAAAAAAGRCLGTDEPPAAFPLDAALTTLATLVEEARACGARSTLHVALGMDASEAPPIPGVPRCVPEEVLRERVSSGRVSDDDLIVASCPSPAAHALADLLRFLSRLNAAPRLAAHDAEGVISGDARAMCRALGIPVSV